jgi:DNA-binding transcriptional LysR family regulator
MDTRKWESRIGRRLRLRDLHIFFAVVQAGSMARAAAGLGMSQPSVSEAIADLEHALGAKLLDRSPHGVLPTAYGEAMLRRGRAAFDELKQGVSEIEHLADPTIGEIRISCPETLSCGLLPAIIDRFSRERPRVVFHVIQDNIATRFRDLRERNADLSLARMIEPLDADDLEVTPLFDDYTRVVAGASNPLTRRRKIDLADIVDEPWIALPSDDFRSLFSVEIFRKAGLAVPEPAVVTYSQHVRHHLLATGRFVTTLSDVALRFNAEFFSLKVLPVKLPVLPRPIAVLTLKNRTPSPLVKSFIECAHAVTKERKGLRR